MTTIWKYQLATTDGTVHGIQLMMPENAQILTAHNQHGIICIWALVDPDKARTSRLFEIVGTGQHLVDCKRKHIGTVLIDNGAFVLHIFELL